jgi:hypothetical protein
VLLPHTYELNKLNLASLNVVLVIENTPNFTSGTRFSSSKNMGDLIVKD